MRRGDPCEVTAAHGEIWEPGLPRQPTHWAIPCHLPSLCQHVPQDVTPSFGFLCFVPCHHSVSSQRTGWSLSCPPVLPAPAEDHVALCTVVHIAPLVPILWMEKPRLGEGGQVSVHGHPENPSSAGLPRP